MYRVAYHRIDKILKWWAISFVGMFEQRVAAQNQKLGPLIRTISMFKLHVSVSPSSLFLSSQNRTFPPFLYHLFTLFSRWGPISLKCHVCGFQLWWKSTYFLMREISQNADPRLHQVKMPKKVDVITACVCVCVSGPVERALTFMLTLGRV